MCVRACVCVHVHVNASLSVFKHMCVCTCVLCVVGVCGDFSGVVGYFQWPLWLLCGLPVSRRK